MRSRSRGAVRPGFAKALPQKEGAGNAGCALHPRSRVQYLCEETHTSIQVQRRQSGIPCAMALRLMARSPRRRIHLVTVIGGLKVLRARLGSKDLRRLDTSNGCQDHTVLPYASAPFVCRAVIAHRPKPALRSKSAPDAAASTASHPNVRDDHDTPLVGDGMAEFLALIWGR
jgi:hypothetical protein